MQTGVLLTAAQTAAALRILVASRYDGNFSNLTRAILEKEGEVEGFKSLNAQLWRAHSEKKPGHLKPDLARRILTLFPRGVRSEREKKALDIIRGASKALPREPKSNRKHKRRSNKRGQRIPSAAVLPQGKSSAIQVGVFAGGTSIGTFEAIYNPGKRCFDGDVVVGTDEDNIVLTVRIPMAKALHLFLL